MRFLVFILIVLVACSTHNKEPDHDTDSLIKELRKELSYHFQHNNKYAPLQYLDSFRAVLPQVMSIEFESVWNTYKGTAFLFQDNFDSSRHYFDHALKILEDHNLPKCRAVAKIQLAAYYLKKNAYDSALAQGLEAIELCKEDSPPELPFLYSQLAFLYRAADDSTNFIKYLFEGLNAATDSIHIAAFSSEIGRYYIQQNQFDSAEYFYKNFNDHNNQAIRYVEARRYEDLAVLCMGQNKNAEAVTYFKQAITLFKKENLSYPWDYLSAGNMLAGLKQYQAASAYLDTALYLARQQDDLENISNALFSQSLLMLEQGNKTAAYLLLDSSYIYHLKYDTIAFRNVADDIEAKTTNRIKDEQIQALRMTNEATRKINRQRLIVIVALSVGSLSFASWAVNYVRRKKMQVRVREMELQLQILKSQIEPHFLFNLLGNLQAHIDTRNMLKAKDYLHRAAKLLRQSIDNASKSFVPLADEINLLEDYLLLQAEQLDNAFDYHIEAIGEIDKDNILVPPMLLQPFVENAIVHGFKNMHSKGKLTIRFTRIMDVLRCQIEDNGNGLAVSANATGAHATAITTDRLRVLGKRTGRKCKLEIIDKSLVNEGRGVRVIIDIPYMHTEAG